MKLFLSIKPPFLKGCNFMDGARVINEVVNLAKKRTRESFGL